MSLLLRWVAAFAALAILAAAGFGSARAQDVQPVPALDARVIDRAGTLSDVDRSSLESKLAAFEANAGPQIAVLIVPTTQPEDIASYAYRIADAWKIGRREVGDGVLIVVSKEERRVRIEVAKALEGAIPDLAARQVIDQAVRPAFRTGDYAGGLNAAIDRLIARINGEALPAPAKKGRAVGIDSPSLGTGIGIFIIAIVAVGAVLRGLFGRTLGSIATGVAAGGIAGWLSASLLIGLGAAIFAVVLAGLAGIGSMMRGGRSRGGLWGGMPVAFGTGFGAGSGWAGGGSSGGGGGFSSGGGGDFGGGGASGDW